MRVGGSARRHPCRHLQAIPAELLFRPYQGLEPAHLVGVADVHGIEVDPCPPGDLGKACGHRDGTRGRAREHRGPRSPPGVEPGPVAVRIAEPVRVQAEAGRGPDLEQGQRLWQHAASNGTSTAHRPTSFVWVLRSRATARIPGQSAMNRSRNSSNPVGGIPTNRAAASTRFGWRFSSGSSSMRATSVSSSAMPSAHCSRQGEAPRASDDANHRNQRAVSIPLNSTARGTHDLAVG